MEDGLLIDEEVVKVVNTETPPFQLFVKAVWSTTLAQCYPDV